MPPQVELIEPLPLGGTQNDRILTWQLPALDNGEEFFISFPVSTQTLPENQFVRIVNKSTLVDHGVVVERKESIVIGASPMSRQPLALACYLDRNVFIPGVEQPLGINFDLNESLDVKIEIHDLSGTHITTLVDQNFPFGQNRICLLYTSDAADE